MKTIHLLLAILFLFTTTLTFAQSSAEQAGIAVQGIARNADNTAMVGDVNFKFTIYYRSSGTTYKPYDPPTLTLKTDAYGVFSHILDVSPVKSSDFANHQMYLKIEGGSPLVEISDEPLKHVPYAISANNGVPMGSIMPFLGEIAPPGWALCKGQTWASVGEEGKSLKTFLGDPTDVPDLQGMFLRGAGANDYTTTVTVLNEKQDDAFQNHTPTSTFEIETNEGMHDHNIELGTDTSYGSADGGRAINFTTTEGEGYVTSQTSTQGTHNHSLTGEFDEISFQDDTNKIIKETRPVNYGVNYIIKL